MPTYSYRCTKCEKVFDSFHSMSCTDPQYCPVCGAVGTKLLSASSVIFKGSGFYSTDYRDSGYLEAQKKDTSSESDKTSKPSAETKTTATETQKTAEKPASTEKTTQSKKAA
ncbi:MAG: hypothetical protein II567_16340 [Candidatus Riflebacteria bacterium]|nr:hypothetical protein [Candidatus Riflebacteria bacterium]